MQIQEISVAMPKDIDFIKIKMVPCLLYSDLY